MEHFQPHSYLICIIREVDFVEDLRGLMLDGLHFHQMRGVLPGSISVFWLIITNIKKKESLSAREEFNRPYRRALCSLCMQSPDRG